MSAFNDLKANAERRETLYEKCNAAPPDTLFFQNDLTGIRGDDGEPLVPDVESLMVLCQELVDMHLFRVLSWEGQPCWKTRSRDIATKMKAMPPDERLVYACIEDSGNTGIWTKSIKAKTNIPQTIMTKSLKSLESKNLVKTINNVKFPTRKMYMLSHLIPSEEVSGGPWHQDGELDQELIEELCKVILTYVERESWVEAPASQAHLYASAKSAKRKAAATTTTSSTGTAIEEAPSPLPTPRYRPPLGPNGRPLIPHPPGYRHYPTTASTLRFIVSVGILGPNIALTEPDLQTLMDLLVFDGRIEKVGGMGYRSVRAPADETEAGPGNGFVEAPCGHCPVFDLCAEGGPVNPANCVYFEQWLVQSLG